MLIRIALDGSEAWVCVVLPWKESDNEDSEEYQGVS